MPDPDAPRLPKLTEADLNHEQPFSTHFVARRACGAHGISHLTRNPRYTFRIAG